MLGSFDLYHRAIITMSQPKIPDRARNYKEDPAPVASQKMVSCLYFLVPPLPPTAPPLLLAPASHRSLRFALAQDRPFCILDRWSFEQRVPTCIPKTVTAAGSFILALFACCSSHCKSRPHTTSYPSSAASTPTWYALPRQAALLPKPASPVALVSFPCLQRSQSAAFLSRKLQQRNPCDRAPFRSHRWSALCCQRCQIAPCLL